MQRGRLSIKEIEALALIAQGHDAKSAAAELSVSTHTIYERLRRAREKLGVSSSREAARMYFSQKGANEGSSPTSAAPLCDVAQSMPEPHSFTFQEPGASQPGIERSYVAESLRLMALERLPLREPGGKSFTATPSERIRLIGDLASRLAMAFVSVCLAALIISNLLAH